VTVLEVLAVTETAKIRLEPRGALLHVEAPAGTMTPELRAALVAHKPLLLAVLDRLSAMRHFAAVAPKPFPYARAWVKGGPGRCLSCGDPLDRPDACGRCLPCDLAVDRYYATLNEHRKRAVV
jgi:hypothetical protein